MYHYEYDNLNRLTNAYQCRQDAPPSQKYDLTLGTEKYTFDRIGNFLMLTRGVPNAQNTVTTQAFTYNYTAGTNKLLQAKGNYTYDINGNLLTDDSKGLNATIYGRANLPTSLSLVGQTLNVTSNDVNYIYDMKDQRIYKNTMDHVLRTSLSKEYYLKDASGAQLGILDMTTNMWTWYINGNELVAKTTPCGENQPEPETADMGDYDNINAADALTQKLREEMRIADSLSLQMPDTLLQIKIGDTLITYIFASRINNIPNSVSYIVLSQTYISEGSQMIDVLDTYGETMSISIDELMQGSNLLSTYNYNGTNDPFYEPYTFYNTLCNTENTYYVYDHLGNTRITYTPTVMPDGLKFTLNGVYDYYPYGKILREYVQGPQEKYLTTHHQRDEETGLDYRGARFYDCDVARFLSLDPLANLYPSTSVYNYVKAQPLLLIDPTGKGDEPTKAKPNKDNRVPITPPTGHPDQMADDDPRNKTTQNCHNFAWPTKDVCGTGQGTDCVTPNWDSEPSNNTTGFHTIGFNEPNKVGDRVVYMNYSEDDKKVVLTHSGIVTKVDKNGNAIEITSKWGGDGIYVHHPRDVPDGYSNDSPKATTPDGTTYQTRIYWRADAPTPTTEQTTPENKQATTNYSVKVTELYPVQNASSLIPKLW
nr:RHS repeat-associated core domain-containing protein [Bacteroidota bacterium]